MAAYAGRMFTESLIFALAAQLITIEGHVVDARTHAGVVLAKVELMRLQTPLDKRYTDADGRFFFGGFPAGPYRIVVESSEYETAAFELDMASAGFPITVELVRKKNLPAINMPPVVSIRPGGDPSVLNDLGNLYRKLGQLGRAEDAFKRARALTDSVFVSLNLADVYLIQKRFKDAESVLLEAVRKQPDSGDAYYGLVLVYLQQGRLDNAEEAALRAVGRPHVIADVHLFLADLYRMQQKQNDSVRQLDLYREETAQASGGQSRRSTSSSIR